MPTRPFVAGRFLFELDGAPCGFVKSIDGGTATAEVIQALSSSSRNTLALCGTRT